MQLRRVAWLGVVLGCGGAYATGEELDAGPAPVDAGVSETGQPAVVDASEPELDDAGVNPGEADADAQVDASLIKDSGVDSATTPDAGYTTWTAVTFTDKNRLGTCTGAKYVRYSPKYKLYVGVQLCTSKRYKIFLSKTVGGTFYEIGDGANGGEDHCEFVVPTFTLGASGAINSGNCPTCKLQGSPETYGGPNVGVFTRANLGDTPVFQNQWPQFNYYTAEWYECGVSIP